MKKFPRIADLIQTLSKGEITARHVPPFFPSIFILVGIPFIWFGGRDSLKYTESTYIFTFIGALLIITGLIILLYNNRYFIAVETRERIKPERYFLNPDECNSLIDMIHKDDINDIMKHRQKHNSPLIIEIWKTSCHKFVYYQLLYYYDAQTRPISAVHMTETDKLAFG